MNALFQFCARTPLLWVVAITLILPSCAPFTPPPIAYFKDHRHAVLLDDMTYQVGNTQQVITVPKGFVTDYASIPGFVKPALEFGGKHYEDPAIVHDWLYWTGRDQQEADLILYQAMRDQGVGYVKGNLIYAGLRIGGWSGWNENKQNRAKGLPRVIPKEYMNRASWPDSWPKYQKYLYNQGVRPSDELNELKTKR